LERSAASFDVLGAESMGQIGYVLAQAMQSVGCTAVPILTQVVVDQYSDAFKDPSKFVGPIYGSLEAQALAQSLGYVIQLYCATWNISILQPSANPSLWMN
jgi:carbamate kinase